MSSDLDQIEQAAMQLSAKERAELADRLWLSLETESLVEAAWAKEIEKRLHEIDSGSVEAVSHEDVIAELRARYGE